MNVENIFTSFLIQTKLKINHKQIAGICLNGLETNDDYNQKNIFHNVSLKNQLEHLFVEIDKIANEAHKVFQYKDSTKQVCIDAWINKQNSFETSRPHQHPTADLAIVYFPMAEKGCANLEFLNPNSKIQYTIHERLVEQWNKYNSSTWSIVPETGKVVIFPGYLIHYVKPNTSNKERLSIAFNYKTVNKL